MNRRAASPTGEPSRTAARNRSPVATCGTPRCSARMGAWVPLPAPGPPRRTTTVIAGSNGPDRTARSPDEPFVVTHHQLRLDLFHRLHDDRDDDEEARSAEAQRAEIRKYQPDERRCDRDGGEEQGAGERDPAHDPGKVVLCRTTRADAGDEAAVLAELLGRLIGLERERGIEVREAHREQEVQPDVDHRLGVEERDDAVRDVLDDGDL